jgi:hypothetical protein
MKLPAVSTATTTATVRIAIVCGLTRARRGVDREC